MSQIDGAVLAGGASRRMGRTKALVEVDGVPMATRVATALLDGGCRGVAVIGGSPDELAPLELEVVADLAPGNGPFGGVISALTHFATASHVLVAACDLALLDARSVRLLLDAAQAEPERAAVVAVTDRVQPALAVWNRAALPGLQTVFDDGERALHRVLETIDTLAVRVDEDVLTNINRPGDLPKSGQTGQ